MIKKNTLDPIKLIKYYKYINFNLIYNDKESIDIKETILKYLKIKKKVRNIKEINNEYTKLRS